MNIKVSNGFTLMEVLVALAVLSIGLLGMAGILQIVKQQLLHAHQINWLHSS